MLLNKIIKSINPSEILFYKKNYKIDYITTNSKLIKKNSIFIVNSKNIRKKEYIKEAFLKGAVVFLSDKKLKGFSFTQLIVKNLSSSVKSILNLLKPNPPNNVIAITGTNGKTSVVWLVSNLLKLYGLNVKSLGTLGFYKNLNKIEELLLTTPEKEELHQFSYSSHSKKNEFVFEASSHGISKNRIKNIPINIAAITNITHDHLDYHRTFKNYKDTKYKLFLKFLSKNQFAIINDNIANIKLLKQKLFKKNIKIISYGKNTSNINSTLFKNKIKIKIYNKNYIVDYKTNTYFELENISCAISCCIAINLNPKKIINLISKITKAEGRMQLVSILNNQAKVYVDYAHTPDALKNVLINNINKNIKPNLVFGCGGNRDKNKRKQMGIIANKYANKIFITDDNPRNENAKNIRDSINFYCPRAFNISSRKLAIKNAINSLESNEVLIIAGKGHEKKQIFKNKTVNFNDFNIAKYFIMKINMKNL